MTVTERGAFGWRWCGSAGITAKAEPLAKVSPKVTKTRKRASQVMSFQLGAWIGLDSLAQGEAGDALGESVFVD